MKILNISRNYYIKYTQALRGIENCAFAWVVEGETVRDMSLAESICKRNEMAKNQEPLAHAELPGIHFKGPISRFNPDQPRNEAFMIRQAHEFCASQV